MATRVGGKGEARGGLPPSSGSEGALLEAHGRRAAFLRSALDRLGVADVAVLEGRAEELAHDGRWRASTDVVVARSFGKPAVTAECGAPFLRLGGSLVVSEPPTGGEERWPAAGLALFGLVDGGSATEGDFHFRILEAVEPCPGRFPRRVGVPAKRPVF